MDVPVYVINLDKDTDRLATVSASLKALGIAFQRLPAIVGAPHLEDPEKVDLARFRSRNRIKQPRAGEVGCYLSHVRALEELVANGAPWGVVLEDDAQCLEGLPEVLRELGSVDDWDIAKLFCFHRGTPITVRRLGNGRSLCVHLTRTTSCAAYAVTRRAAQVLIPRLIPMSQPVDHALDRPWESGLRIRGVRPFVVGLAPHCAVTTLGKKERRPEWKITPGVFFWRSSTEVCRFVHGAVSAAAALASGPARVR
jgi:glycosyl transferase family 25